MFDLVVLVSTQPGLYPSPITTEGSAIAPILPDRQGRPRPSVDSALVAGHTFPVHPDPKPGPEDRYGDVVVDTNRAHQVYREWLAMARPAPGPGGLRRPRWLPRAFMPDASTYHLEP